MYVRSACGYPASLSFIADGNMSFYQWAVLGSQNPGISVQTCLLRLDNEPRWTYLMYAHCHIGIAQPTSRS